MLSQGHVSPAVCLLSGHIRLVDLERTDQFRLGWLDHTIQFWHNFGTVPTVVVVASTLNVDKLEIVYSVFHWRKSF